MSILTINNLAQSFGAFTVFSGLSATIPHGAKIGLVGPNGIGKTSLLLILADLAAASGGKVFRSGDLRLGYLRQEAADAFIGRQNTVYDEMLTVFAGLKEMETQLGHYEDRMAAGETSPELLDAYGTLQEQYQHAGGYDYDVRIQQTLSGLGFSEQHYQMPLDHLSGGQKTRALLARLLLEQPDLLILDEPTNHLDVEAVEWLEHALRLWEGALLVVSHDRYFLDEVVTTIWEMSRDGIQTFRGNYSAYLKQREDRWEWQERVYEEEKERLLQEIDFIKRNIVRASTNARAVGRLRLLSRDLYAIEEVGLMAFREAKNWSSLGVENRGPMGVMEAESLIRSLRSPNARPPKLALRLRSTFRSGDLVIRTRDLEIGYPADGSGKPLPLFSADDITLTRKEVAALIGQNGTGKSTFLKTIMGQLQPLSGNITLGASLKVGYFAQAHDGLDHDNSVMDALLRHKEMPLSAARNHLAQYLFRGDDVFKKVGMLSGGERGKLALAILALEGANLLLLDEPTNHLDINAQEVLQEVLENFEGTILMVTHDRYLVDQLATQIWDLREGYLHVFRGSYQEYLAARATARQQAKDQPKPSKAMPAHTPNTSTAQVRKQTQLVERVEQQIAQVESALARIERALTKASEQGDKDKIQQLSREHATTQAELTQLMEQWTEVAT